MNTMGNVPRFEGLRMSTAVAIARPKTPSLKLRTRLSMGNSLAARLPPLHQRPIATTAPMVAAVRYAGSAFSVKASESHARSNPPSSRVTPEAIIR